MELEQLEAYHIICSRAFAGDMCCYPDLRRLKDR